MGKDSLLIEFEKIDKIMKWWIFKNEIYSFIFIKMLIFWKVIYLLWLSYQKYLIKIYSNKNYNLRKVWMKNE